MSRIIITGGIVLAVLLLHYSYVDFRFRHRDGVLWFWLMAPAPPLIWASRAAVAGAGLAAIATLFLGATKPIAIIIIALMVVHVATLIAIEMREGR
jgi:hypothetical protein